MTPTPNYNTFTYKVFIGFDSKVEFSAKFDSK